MKQTARDGHRIRRSCGRLPEKLSADLVSELEDRYTETVRRFLVRIHEQEPGQKDRRSQRTDREVFFSCDYLLMMMKLQILVTQAKEKGRKCLILYCQRV